MRCGKPVGLFPDNLKEIVCHFRGNWLVKLIFEAKIDYEIFAPEASYELALIWTTKTNLS